MMRQAFIAPGEEPVAHGAKSFLSLEGRGFYRDAKIIEIYEGTKEIEKLIIARAML